MRILVKHSSYKRCACDVARGRRELNEMSMKEKKRWRSYSGCVMDCVSDCAPGVGALTELTHTEIGWGLGLTEPKSSSVHR